MDKAGKGFVNTMSQKTLLYEQITYYLKSEIKSGILKPGDKLPTEMELAEKFNVSRITSKRALEDLRIEGAIYRVRGSGSFVSERKSSPETGNMDVVGDVNRSKVIAFVLPFDTLNGGIMNVVSGASRAIEGKDYLLSIHCCNNNLDEERELLTQLYEKGVSGIMYYPISDSKNLEVANMFYLEQFPCVSIDKYFESVPLSYVVSDNLLGSYEVTKHLIELGHKKIAFLSDNRIDDATSVRNRYFGYSKALKEYGIPMDMRLVKNGDFHDLDEESGKAILSELIKVGMTAACTINDYVANFVINNLTQLGVMVPDNISVTGFDDLEFAGLLSTPLTTVRQDLVSMGQYAMEYLMDCIENGVNTRYQKVLPTQLIVRKSTKEIASEYKEIS